MLEFFERGISLGWFSGIRFGGVMGSADLLFQIAEFFRVKEFGQADVQSIAKHFDGDNAWILAFTVDDTFQC